jgi:anthranilate phosphoribosyltransferase
MADSPLTHAIRRLTDGGQLSGEETAAAFAVVMRGEASPPQIAALLIGLRARGETAEQVAGAAQALRDVMQTVRLPSGAPVIDTCGTGGGAIGTFNLSTASAFVAAGAGARVAKHGNRSYTSNCGSADLLEALGLEITLTPERATEVLERAGMVFLFAPAFHPAMKHAVPVRKELAVPTVMNLIGPLANPAGVSRQVIGVADRDRAPLVAQALARLGTVHALVVHAEVGMDEISPYGCTQVWEIRDGTISQWSLDPAEYDLEHPGLEGLAGAGPAENARRVVQLLEGGEDPVGRAALLLNSAAAIYVAGLESSFGTAVGRARKSLMEGAALQALQRLRKEVGKK